MNPKVRQIFLPHGLAISYKWQEFSQKLFEVATVEWKGQWRADQGRKNPAARWQVSSAVKASNGVLLRLFLMAGSWPCIRFICASSSFILQASCWFLGALYTCKNILVCVSQLALTCVCNQECWLDHSFNFILHPMSLRVTFSSWRLRHFEKLGLQELGTEEPTWCLSSHNV